MDCQSLDLLRWAERGVGTYVYDGVYTARKINTASVAATAPPVPSDDGRASEVNEQFGVLEPKVAQLTNDVVFGQLWRRADLNLRKRSPVTIAALAGMAGDDQLGFHLCHGVESGLKREQMAKALTLRSIAQFLEAAGNALTICGATHDRYTLPSRNGPSVEKARLNAAASD